MMRLKTKEDTNILPEFSSSNKTARKKHIDSEYSISTNKQTLKVKEYPNLMHINGIIMRSTQKEGKRLKTGFCISLHRLQFRELLIG